MNGEEKLQLLIDGFQKIYPWMTVTGETLFNRNQRVRLRDLAFSNDPGAYERAQTWIEKKLVEKENPTTVEPKVVSLKKKAEPVISESQKEYDEALKLFKPQFGNMQHIKLMDQIGKERKLREHVNSLEKKRGQLTSTIAKATQSQKDLTTLQKSVANAIKASYAPPESSS